MAPCMTYFPSRRIKTSTGTVPKTLFRSTALEVITASTSTTARAPSRIINVLAAALALSGLKIMDKVRILKTGIAFLHSIHSCFSSTWSCWASFSFASWAIRMPTGPKRGRFGSRLTSVLTASIFDCGCCSLTLLLVTILRNFCYPLTDCLLLEAPLPSWVPTKFL